MNIICTLVRTYVRRQKHIHVRNIDVSACAFRPAEAAAYGTPGARGLRNPAGARGLRVKATRPERRSPNVPVAAGLPRTQGSTAAGLVEVSSHFSGRDSASASLVKPCLNFNFISLALLH